ncbi:cobalt-precorrin-6A reductase [Micromonospora sp. NBC_01813]|uniref:cobalt-precorrin-6A reductase n=1 Tax=Micromonospora sp. NBC_01813 TaxID=2975988 RepID=UPI002DDA659F|nr:cobalt-precorrin-6A reductase [Micromonospora sp. NBC_01813]WSA10648.1 cobalt-precorrin-6A reductase [Micromonospora sp. NBC_01813]
MTTGGAGGAGPQLRVLILGGTAQARQLAAELAAATAAAPSGRVVTSLAGRVARPRLPAGETRVGGFGGPVGLARWLRDEQMTAVVDATHPFATRISASAVAACAETGVALLALRRPGWVAGPGDDWHRVPGLTAAAAALPALGRRAMLTTGRQSLAAFAPLDGIFFLIRTVDPPQPPLPADRVLLLDRGPYTVDGELALMRRHDIDVLVTKDSGGEETAAKLTAARHLGLPVLMVDRTPAPDTATVATVDAALAWLLAQPTAAGAPGSQTG